MAAGAGYQFGEFVLNLDRGCLQKAGADLALRPKSLDVLRYLVERAGRLVPKDEVVDAVWPKVTVSDDALTQCIRDIRKVLGDDGERFIRTVQRRGYIFVAEAAPLAPSEAPPPRRPSAKGVTAADGPAPARAPASLNGHTAAITALAALTAFTLVAGALAVWALGWLDRRPPATETRMTIAVLPFATQAEDWLGDGIAEDVLTAVSRFRDLTVIGRYSSFRYRGEAVDVRQIGKDLNAQYIVQGTVRRDGDRVRVTAQLVDAKTAATRWTERYDRPSAEVFAIQDDVVDKVAAQLVVHAREATAARLRAKPPASLEVYELALRGRKSVLAFTRDGTIEGKALAERAIGIDPTYAPAQEALAQALMQLYLQPYSEHQGTPAMLQQARAALEKAVALDPHFSNAHSTLGWVLMWAREHEASLEAFRKAIGLNASDGAGYRGYADALSFGGRHRESIEAWERAERLDPFYPATALALRARAYTMLGEFEPALRLTSTCAERLPKLFTCFIYRAAAAAAAGLEDEARAAARRLLEVYPKFSIQRHMRMLPFRSEADAGRFAGYLRRAGLPE